MRDKSHSSRRLPTSRISPICIWDLASAMERHWAESLAQFSLGTSEYRILRVCSELQRCTAVDIAARTPVDPSSISRIVHRLVNKGLLARRRSQTDRRLVTLRLTEDGEELMDELSQHLLDLQNLITKNLTQKAIRSWNSSIAKMFAAFDPSG